MVNVPAPRYPTDGEWCVSRKDFLILAASAGKESDETDMIAFEGPLADIFIPLPVQCWLKYFLTKPTWFYPCLVDALSVTLLILLEALIASSSKEHQTF
jgi:hypothetical protein